MVSRNGILASLIAVLTAATPAAAGVYEGNDAGARAVPPLLGGRQGIAAGTITLAQAPHAADRRLVQRAQEFLAAQGFAPGPVDGLLGPKTRTAIKAFQAAEGLAATGELDDAFVAHMDGVITAARLAADEQTLLAAAEQGEISVVERLLANGVDANVKRDDGWTPLLLATEGGYLEVVSTLLANNADPNEPNNIGLAPIHIAAKNGYGDILVLLLRSGVDVNAVGSDDVTALMLAAQAGHADIVKRLIEEGADVNARNGSNSTALIVASFFGHADIVKMLLEAGADPSVVHSSGSTALDVARQQGNDEIVRILSDAQGSEAPATASTPPKN